MNKVLMLNAGIIGPEHGSVDKVTREEIAQQFATNTNTVKSWLHRGAERLKLCLEAKHQSHH